MLGWMATALPLRGQSVSPPIAEYQEKARSSFQLHNGSLFPLTVVLEVRGFRVTEAGEVVDTPLDTSRVHVKLSAMSFRIPPRGSYRVFYEATGDTLPAWFNILSAMSGARTDNGLNVRLLLPHVVYLNQKQPLKKNEVAIRAFQLDAAGQEGPHSPGEPGPPPGASAPGERHGRALHQRPRGWLPALSQEPALDRSALDRGTSSHRAHGSFRALHH